MNLQENEKSYESMACGVGTEDVLRYLEAFGWRVTASPTIAMLDFHGPVPERNAPTHHGQRLGIRLSLRFYETCGVTLITRAIADGRPFATEVDGAFYLTGLPVDAWPSDDGDLRTARELDDVARRAASERLQRLVAALP